jgi:hypothetical protein
MTDALSHFGVAGMHWGVRKADNPGYGSAMRTSDEATWGKSGVRRINDHMNAGKTHGEAIKSEQHRNLVKVALGVGLLALPPLIEAYGPTAMSSISNKAQTNRGRASMANLRGLGAAESSEIFKKSRKGVYNITTLK